MRILLIQRYYWPAVQYGGTVFATHHLLKTLVRKGMDVTVYTTNLGLEGKVAESRAVEVDGVGVFYFPYLRMLDFLGSSGWQYSPSMSKALSAEIRSYDVVMITGVWSHTFVAATRVCRKQHVPYIVSPHGTLMQYSSGMKKWKKYPYFKLIVNHYLKDASVIHYTTQLEAEQSRWAGHAGSKTTIIPNGIILPMTTPDGQTNRLYEKYPHLLGKEVLLYLGRIHPIKGLDILMRSLSTLTKERKSLHLLIAGGDDGDGFQNTVAGWVKDYHLEAHVTFTGMLSGQDKIDAFRCAKLFVLPSYSENFGMAVIEAMSYGIPVILSNKVGVCREIEEYDAGMVVNPDDASLCQGIKTILKENEIARCIAVNARKMVAECYNIDVVADKIIDLCQQVTKTDS